MTYAESCARWIEKRRAVNWVWRGLDERVYWTSYGGSMSESELDRIRKEIHAVAERAK